MSRPTLPRRKTDAARTDAEASDTGATDTGEQSPLRVVDVSKSGSRIASDPDDEVTLTTVLANDSDSDISDAQVLVDDTRLATMESKGNLKYEVLLEWEDVLGPHLHNKHRLDATLTLKFIDTSGHIAEERVTLVMECSGGQEWRHCEGYGGCVSVDSHTHHCGECGN